MTEPSWDPDQFADLGDELRRGAGAEFFAEAAEIEEETHRLRRRRRTLGDYASELVQRGDEVAFRVGERTVTGLAVFAGSDYLTVRTGLTEATVRLAAVAIAVRRRTEGGHVPVGGARTFKARLAEFEMSGEPVTLVAPTSGLDLEARIELVATDHLVAHDVDGGEWLIPVARVSLVLRELPTSPCH